MKDKSLLEYTSKSCGKNKFQSKLRYYLGALHENRFPLPFLLYLCVRRGDSDHLPQYDRQK